MVDIYTKESLIVKLVEVKKQGWILGTRQGNYGNIGNTLEKLLGIEENNLPIPNAAEWELKCKRLKTNSLVTLFHNEPSPTALKFVPSILLPNYGWKHQQAGVKYPETEKSFRQTLTCGKISDRGFTVNVDRNQQKIAITFNAKAVSSRHEQWLAEVEQKVGLGDLPQQPYWGFKDIYHKAGTKLHNCFFVVAEARKQSGQEYFKYSQIFKLSGFSMEKFIAAIEGGDILIDFDARTGHNHGTKFRFRNNQLTRLYDEVEEID